MEVFFLDVAQGTCQVLLLGGRRAIVIDCGDSNSTQLLQFLSKVGIDEVEALIISHSDDDHIGGATAVLGAYQDRIKKICFVQDHAFLESRFWSRTCSLIQSGVLEKEILFRLECTKIPQVIWNEGEKVLRTYSPTPFANLQAQAAEVRNPTSAIVVLSVGSKRVVFASDAEIPQWKDINARFGQIDCEILAVPHHAGKIHHTAAELAWLFTNALAVRTAVVSVGTSNTYGHPRRDVLQALRTQGATVLCTQITHQCNAGSRDLELLRPAVLKPQVHIGRSCASEDLTLSGNSRNVACGGTIRAEVTLSGGIVIDRLSDHQSAVDTLAASGRCVLCRP